MLLVVVQITKAKVVSSHHQPAILGGCIQEPSKSIYLPHITLSTLSSLADSDFNTGLPACFIFGGASFLILEHCPNPHLCSHCNRRGSSSLLHHHRQITLTTRPRRHHHPPTLKTNYCITTYTMAEVPDVEMKDDTAGKY